MNNEYDDYLDGVSWATPFNSKGHREVMPYITKYKKRPAPPTRICECGVILTRYNKKSKCYSCQDKKK